MKINKKILIEYCVGLKNALRRKDLSKQYADTESPLRAELFSAAQMEKHGKILANSHKIDNGQGVGDLLLARLADNEKIITEACNVLTAAIKAGRQITPAGEWLLDNFYLIEEQIRIAKRHLPKGYSKELPRLLKGPAAGSPRVYNIASEIISHGDGRVDPDNLSRFVTAYQQVKTLKLGELWAIPIMLRLALIENLRRVAAQIATGRLHRNIANAWADQMIEASEKDPSSLILLVADMARSNPPLVGSFIAELARLLQGQSPGLTLPLTWVSHRLAESSLTIEQLVQSETQQQAADQVSISNSIGSLRFLGTMDWREFVETMSVVEQTLRFDGDNVYRHMDFSTRDHYRHVIEKIAKHSPLPELEVAERAMQLANENAARNNADLGDPRALHVGFYLIGNGLPELEKIAGMRLPFWASIKKTCGKCPLRVYLGAIGLLIAVCTAYVAQKAYQDQMHIAILVLMILASILATSHLAVSLVNWLSTLLTTPHPLPRMDFSAGIPESSRTLVAVPTILFDAHNVESLCEGLEVRFLANRDDNLRFCLLTDFTDAQDETTSLDAPLLQQIQKNIEQLNLKYADNSDDPFILLHRPRSWNEQEKVWMGYERKRGKLAALNALILSGESDAFSLIVGKISDIQSIKYVITLDTDTQLSRDSARQFVATIAHPLNRARYDEGKKRVIEGYGILQPRVAVSLPSKNASFYENLCGGEPGIDPYTRTISDVYQDVFHEGSFIGKGIYDVQAFERALYDHLPENRILSHDLLEGCFARAGLMSDTQLYEEYPPTYSADVKRRTRWIRGDWQLLAWLMPKVPTADTKRSGKLQKNPLSTLSRWKLLDNLRRSLTSSTLTLLLLLGWIFSPSPVFWTTVILGIIVIPSLFAALLDLARKPKDVLFSQHLSTWLRSSRLHFATPFLTLVLLPYDAFFSLGAILRTVWRMLVSHRNLLEWNPSSQTNSNASSEKIVDYFRKMWISPTLAVATAITLVALNPYALLPAALILLLWLGGPAVAWQISQPMAPPEAQIVEEQAYFLRRLARKTWAFFETFVGPEDNWLPPDNMQESPVAVVAHRTSPTNIGMALLANLAAYDFGYIQVGQFLKRTENTLRTMDALERHQGHFYNWYDTQSLRPLEPIYISTVDSGNLAAHLLTLRPGLQSLLDQPILSARLFEGIDDTLRILLDIAPGDAPVHFSQFRTNLKSACTAPPTNLAKNCAFLHRLTENAAQYAASLDNNADSEVHFWAKALAHQCRDAHNELVHLAPWIFLPMSGEWDADIFLADAELDAALTTIPSLRQLAGYEAQLRLNIEGLVASETPTAEADPRSVHRSELVRCIKQGSQRAIERMATIERLTLQAGEFARMEYGFLYDPATHLMSIGYTLHERRRDTSFYDLLASEARLCSFVAIAQGQLPQETWFALGRQLTIAAGKPTLLSWSGSMFEYLMPLLVMPTFENTLLDQTYKAAVEGQINYGKQRAVPWGISESGYNTFDANLNYQYRAFGIPGLGLKRGLGDDLVVAPYASMLALMVAPEEACINLQRLSAEGFEGNYGMYEAIDYTLSRLPRGQPHAVIRSFMAHHQGMGLLSLAYLLLDRPMQRRFESDVLFQATMLLLHERIPKATAFYFNTTALADIRTASSEQEMPMRIIKRADTRLPEVQLLSNGRYHVMVTNSGGSYSRWKDLAVTRWREDSTCDNWGTFCYVRDVRDGSFWSTAYQPTLVQPQPHAQHNSYEVIFSEGRAEFRRHDNGFDMHTEIVVSPEDDIELRRTRITNRSRTRRTIDITSYAEVVLAPAAADAMHPAFSNLFVQTEIMQKKNAILCTRRPRSENEKMPLMLHVMSVHNAPSVDVSFETDRMQFIGRGNSVIAPQAMTDEAPLSGSAGSVLDPIVAIRHRITLEPEQYAIVDMVTGIAETREEAQHLIEKYQDKNLADRVFELAWTHSQAVLRQLNASETDAQLYGRLANSVIYANASLRGDASILAKNQRGQSGLWGYAISGDLPIVLVQIKTIENIDLIRQMVQAHAYWRLKGLSVDLVIWYEDHASYRQLLQEKIMGMIASGVDAHAIDRPGGIFVRPVDHISHEDRILLQSVARAIISDGRGTLAEQINRRAVMELRVPQLVPARNAPTAFSAPPIIASHENDLILFNGLGGFTPDGREYVITTTSEKCTPAPWVNVLANPHFGSVISENGGGYTWGENAHEFRLTPWNNDPVSDASGEAFYLRDEQSGEVWSPTALPRRGKGSYTTRHGFGYSVFEHTEDGIHSELWIYVALDASIKYAVLKVRNDSGIARRLSATGYVEWVLGDMRHKSAMHVITEVDPVSGALFARNLYNTEFTERIAFFDVDATTRTFTGDRSEFIGRNGTLQHPAAMSRTHLSGKVGAGLDPCGAICVPFDLSEGQEHEVVFMLGVAGRRSADVSSLVHRNRGATAARNALERIHRHWEHTLTAVQIETPDLSINVLANGWLMYQTIACRLWARSGYYQSGGAYGFRDQLQDVMAMIHTEPQLVRDHLLLCAAHQFVEGDVQHWWHPPSDRGVRTHCSDDYLWLPLATHRYVMSTADTGVLDETAFFLQGRPVNHDEDSYYDLPTRSSESGSLYEHCVRAISRGLNFGEHGLPLIGSCDWNDGMDKVGEHGKGESIWLAFFLYDVLTRFSEVAELHDDPNFGELCQTQAAQLRKNIEQHGWDGGWYRRAYFDDGTPLGSSGNAECQIDSISQSWSVLSGAGNPQRSRVAMQAVDQRLVRRDHGLIQLLDPPFDKTGLNPGYIRGYVPGVRENGGQYTHAAIWTAMAFAKMGDNQRAWELLDMINPVNHGTTPEQIATYKVEPYVVAADVYAVSPHIGRGGWTWYTGSAGWMYRLIVEALLGLNREGDQLRMTPCLPADWHSFRLRYRYLDTTYNIVVTQCDVEKASVAVDGIEQSATVIALINDRQNHSVKVDIPKTAPLPKQNEI